MKKVNCPQTFSTVIRSTTECALQRAIILGEQSQLGNEKVTWLDIEIPVNISGNPRGHCIDLIGIDSKENYVLCEIKFRRKSRDSGNPEKAANQLREYMKEIQKNYKMFDKSYHHKNGRCIDWEKVAAGKTRLVVVANEAYWKSWYAHHRKNVSYNVEGIECYSVNIEEETFVSQKAMNETYTPAIPDEAKEWKSINQVTDY